MQTITTKYHGATNTLPSRFSATSESGIRVYSSYNYELDADKNHAKAAKKLMDKLNWTGDMVGGSTKDGYCFVFVNDMAISN